MLCVEGRNSCAFGSCVSSDCLHECRNPGACFEKGLSRKGYGLQRALIVPALQNPNSIREEEIVDSQGLPLNDVDHFVKTETLVELGVQGEEHVPKGYPTQWHGGHGLELREA